MSVTHPKIWSLLTHIVGPVLRGRYGYTFDDLRGIEGPYLLLCNHTMDLDPAFVGIATGQPVRFVASEHIQHHKFLSGLLTRFLVPIYHQKGKQGRRTVVNIMRALREGDCVGLFPEGNRCYNGLTGPFHASGKLAKSADARVVTYRIEGGYFTQPRWGKGMRRGKIFGRLVHVYEPEELAAMSVDDMDRHLQEDLHVDAYATQEKLRIPYKGKDLCLGMESALFCCPSCGKIGTLTSTAGSLTCGCGLSLRYTELGDLIDDRDGSRTTVTALDRKQRTALRSLTETAGLEDVLFSDTVTLQKIGDDHNVTEEAAATLRATKTGFLAETEADLPDLSFDSLEGVAIYGRNVLVIMTKDGTHCEIRGDIGFSALKYLYLYQIVTNKELL